MLGYISNLVSSVYSLFLFFFHIFLRQDPIKLVCILQKHLLLSNIFTRTVIGHLNIIELWCFREWPVNGLWSLVVACFQRKYKLTTIILSVLIICMLVCSIGQPGGKPTLLSALITCRLVFMAFLLNATPGGSSMRSTAHWLLSILSLASSITDDNILLSYAFSNLNVNTFPPSPKIITLHALTVLSRSHGKQSKTTWYGLIYCYSR